MTQTIRDISIVVPVYNEHENVSLLVEEINQCSSAHRILEILFIDDGSRDGTREVIEGLCAEHSIVKAIFFRRNFGKSAALDAGFRHARGQFVVTMDGDLQDDPNEVARLIAKMDEGYDMVSGWKVDRQDPIGKTAPSRLFNFVTRSMSGVQLHDFNCGLKAYRAEAVRELHLYGELHRFIPVLVDSRGFVIGEIGVNHRPRLHGRSKYGAGRMIRGLLDFITITFLSRYNRRPLHFFGTFGFLALTIGLGIDLALIINKLIDPSFYLTNKPQFFLANFGIVIGFQLFAVGLFGEMLVNMRPGDSHYSVAKRVKIESPARREE